MIADSLRAVGAARSIVIDEHDKILAGNGLCEAAAEVGITKVQVVDADGETLIAVRRTGLTPEQKTQLALYDNRTSELSAWNPDALALLVSDGVDLARYEFDNSALSTDTMLSTDIMPERDHTITEQYVIILTCRNEAQQRELLDRFVLEGLSCRAVIS